MYSSDLLLVHFNCLKPLYTCDIDVHMYTSMQHRHGYMSI